MEYDQRTYFVENEYDDVKGFTVLRAKNGRYHLAEKWIKEDGEDRWLDYWIPEGDLLERVEDDKCDEKAQLTDDQFTKVCQLSGQDYHKNKVTA